MVDEHAITTARLRKAFGDVVALEGLTVEIPRASVGLLGANGAGKTTLIKLALGLQRPSGGNVHVFGLDAAQDGPAVRARVGYMPESDCLPLDVTAADLVAHMAEMSGLPHRAARLRSAEVLYHCGVDEERYRMLREFSTGMKQRVKLAQAIVHDPDLIFLDEPTNGMDPAGREEMLGLISRIHRDLGIAVMLSSHVLEDVERVCDHVVMLDRGRLVAAGPVGDLLEGTGEILVQVGEDAGPFAERLTAAGLTVSVEGTALLVEHRDDGVFDLIRDTAVDLGVALRGLRLRTRSLEDVYLGGTGVTEPREEVSSGRAG